MTDNSFESDIVWVSTNSNEDVVAQRIQQHIEDIIDVSDNDDDEENEDEDEDEDEEFFDVLDEVEYVNYEKIGKKQTLTLSQATKLLDTSQNDPRMRGFCSRHVKTESSPQSSTAILEYDYTKSPIENHPLFGLIDLSPSPPSSPHTTPPSSPHTTPPSSPHTTPPSSPHTTPPSLSSPYSQDVSDECHCVECGDPCGSKQLCGKTRCLNPNNQEGLEDLSIDVEDEVVDRKISFHPNTNFTKHTRQSMHLRNRAKDISRFQEEEDNNTYPSICMARIWNKGNGRQCSRKCINNTYFCKQHTTTKSTNICKDERCPWYGKRHTEGWQHLGRIDEKPPSFFNKKAMLQFNERISK